MSAEDAFLAAIQDAPHDRATRLIYADWLEERGDARGELIRIEEEMRSLPVFTDRYWQLKTRRNQRRQQAAADWLQKLRYGTDCEPVFGHGIPEGWKERWRLIREFTEHWHGRPMSDVGGHAEEIAAVEARLGRTLPPSIREWLAFAHDVRTSPHYLDVLRDTCTMKQVEGYSALSLLLQCEGDYHWAVRHEDLTLPDPPIYGFHWDFENENEEVFVPDENNPIYATVTAFALNYVMDYTHAQGGGFGTSIRDPTQLRRDLQSAFPVHCHFDHQEIFEADNILIRLFASAEFMEARFSVEVAKPMPREAIPAFLWDHTRNGGSFHGMFIQDRHRLPAPRQSVGETESGEEIPF